MIELLQIAEGVVERGLIFGFTVASVYISSCLIRFDNLAVEGAFGLGGALAALLISWQVHPWIGIIAATLIGGLSGVATGILYTKLKVNNLISGIVVTTGLFSVILALVGANMTLNGKQTIFILVPSFIAPHQPLFILTVLCVILFCLISWLLKTEIGFLLQTVGSTPQMITNLGKSLDGYTIFGLTVSNMLAALSGALFVNYTGYFSIWTNVGILIIGLAGMILAQVFKPGFGIALVIGSIVYQAVIVMTFELQLNQDWNKLITALLIVLLIVAKQWLKKR